MKAILCSRYGTPDDLELGDLPEPQPGEGEVVVKVAAAALNFFDTLLLAGRYQVKPDFPFSPAAEFAGTVHGIGAGVTGFTIGDRVMGYAGYGAAREYVVAKAARLVKVPDNLDLDRAAGLVRHLWHHDPCAEGSREAESRRDACGARRCRRHRTRGDRARQGDGCARDRLRLVRREMRIRETARRRRDGELRLRTICARS